MYLKKSLIEDNSTKYKENDKKITAQRHEKINKR